MSLPSIGKGGSWGTHTLLLLETLQDELTEQSSVPPFSGNEDATSSGQSVDGMYEGKWGFWYGLAEGIKGVTCRVMTWFWFDLDLVEGDIDVL